MVWSVIVCQRKSKTIIIPIVDIEITAAKGNGAHCHQIKENLNSSLFQ